MLNVYAPPASHQQQEKNNSPKTLMFILLLAFLSFVQIVSAQTLVQSGFTSVSTPQFFASGSSSRLPVMFRATVTGLAANTSYRYFTQAAIASDFGGSNPGAGNPLLLSNNGTTYTYSTGASISTTGNYSTFTTDASGNFTGWFGVVNTGNERFAAGNLLFPTIVIGNTSGTTLHRRALNVSIKVLAFSTSAGYNNGSFLKGNSSATAKNLVALYDNVDGTGRPLFIAPVESIGATIASVVPAYSTTAGTWNAIIPNNNAGGVKRLEQLSVATGALVGCATDEDGVWPTGPLSTVNPTNGTTSRTIAAADAPLTSCIVCGVITVSANAGLIDCPSGSTSVVVTAAGGVAPYTGTGTFTATAGSHQYIVTDANGCSGSITINIAAGTDTIKPGLYLQGQTLSPGVKGLSSSQSPYIKPSQPGVKFTALLTTGDTVNDYRMAGIPDGIGAFDNNNGTFTILLNHEIGNTLGVARAHGGKGAFVSKWIVNKADLSVISGSDLMQQVYLWDTTTQAFVLTQNVAFSRFCSADLPAISAFYNSSTGKGTQERIFMNGEESGNEGRGVAHIITGSSAGISYELPSIGKFSWENSVASPASGDKTVVAGLDDTGGGQVYMYVGDKKSIGNDIEKAGLHGGKLYGIKVNGYISESNGVLPALGTRFEMFDLGDVKNKTGLLINTESVAAGVTGFLRPEDGAWDPKNPNDFYFATTNGFNSPTRLWRLRFDNILDPQTGGIIEAVLPGGLQGEQMFDNIGVDAYGNVILTEDVGNNEHIGKIWQYNIAADSLRPIAYHDSLRFITNAPNFLTRDEEASGIIDVSEILGAGTYLIDVQAHFASTAELVEGGQLLVMYNPLAFGNSSAPDTVCAFTGSGCVASSVVLGTPAASDNCALSSVSNNAPPVFPLGTTIVTWTATDASGNTTTVEQVVIISDSTAPVILAPAAVNVATNDGCTANGVNLGMPVIMDACSGVDTVYNNAPASFPLGNTMVTWTVRDSSGNTSSATQTVTVVDTLKPAIYLSSSVLVPGITGLNSSQSPYLKPSLKGIGFKSILTVGDGPAAYKMAGIPDGLGAFDNGDTTFTVLMNHEINNSLGIIRAHGGKGAFVSKWIINKSTLAVVSGMDLMQQVYLWDTATQTFIANPSVAFSRFCSADLPAVSAFFNSASGLGTLERIFMNGEESGAEGKGVAHIVTGTAAGHSYELPYLGKFAWENALASPASGDKTVVVGTDDGTGGQVYVYVGTKTNSGTDIDKAGLNNGKLYGVKVTGYPVETNGSVPAAGTRFEMFAHGNVQNKAGLALNTESVAGGVTTFLRPEDGAWDPANPNDFYFVTTNGFNAPTRLWRLRFDNILSPETGGTVEAVLAGNVMGEQMLDNISADRKGFVMMVEDVGNNEHLGKVWQYNIATDSLTAIAYHDSTRFITGAPNFLTRDEEASGIIDVSDILGQGMYLVDVQAHYGTTTELVEGGQLLVMYNPLVFGTSTASDTVRVTVMDSASLATVNLGTPSVADNCSISSVSNNAPAGFPVGTTIVTWTVTDGSGNTATVQQVVIVSIQPNTLPTISITSPANGANYTVGQPIPLTAQATDTDGSISKVVFYDNGVEFFRDSVAPYQYTGIDIPAGIYVVTAKAFDNRGDSAISDTVRVTVAPCVGSGSILAEGYVNIPGNLLVNLASSPKYPSYPDVVLQLDKLEYGPNIDDNYGGRVRGYICAPITGDYIFYLSSDGQSELYLSTDDKPINIRRIAYVQTQTAFRSYFGNPTQRSVPIRLVAGARYYVETIHKEGTGDDHLSVGWRLPNGVLEAPIAGNKLSPWAGGPMFTSNGRTFEEAMATAIKGWSVKVTPNPSANYFTITTRSNSEEKVSISLIDVLGRVIERKTQLTPNGTIQIGNELIPGVYFIEVMQGARKERVRIVKQ